MTQLFTSLTPMYAVVFGALLLIELLYLRIARICNIVDKPSARGSSIHVTIRGGGIIFYFGALLCYLLTDFSPVWFGLALTAITVVSFIDDVTSLEPRTRLLIHFAGMFLLMAELGLYSSGLWLWIPVALIVFTGIINVYNFMDGINGMTGGYSLVVMCTLLWINNTMLPFADNRLIIYSILSIIVFCIFNFRKRAKCFAGDVGAMSIALIIVYLMARLVITTGNFSWIALLAVYGVDGCLTIIHRIMMRENVTMPHRKHLFQIMANELRFQHTSVSTIYMLVQILLNVWYLWHPGYLTLFLQLLLLSFVYLVFIKKYYYLHKLTLQALDKDAQMHNASLPLSETLMVLLRHYLWNKPLDEAPTLTEKQYEKLMFLARKQAITGIITHTLIRENAQLGQPSAVNMFRINREVAMRNNAVNESLAQLCALLKPHGIRFFIVKGQTINSQYPTNEARLPGDIDFYCYPDCYQQARDLLIKRWGVTFNKEKGVHQESFVYNNVRFELHAKLVDFSNIKLQNKWEKIINKCPLTTISIAGADVPVLTPAYNLLYTFIHFYLHLIDLGIGLKQLADLAVLMDRDHDIIDVKTLDRELHALSLHRAFRAVQWVVSSQLCLPEEKQIFNVENKDKKYEKDIMDIIMSGGNFGYYNVKYPFRSGWKYYVNSYCNKVMRYVRFINLSPKENIVRLTIRLLQKIYYVINNR